ncbi:MAG: DUF2877 domain-containing protein [Thermogemmatispora sp.]|uniref:DUF2877 domain-containing protein n=1 Tax=Thermogemmatispora sp. TaxID=1968838 RepID=UPI00260D3742|nr:DUF2877 domain-containing protein [Thermogemmatispora sp.]MBX5458491.1 DUF2877 domain-containing protein [Thermogemmatispora sp.]
MAGLAPGPRVAFICPALGYSEALAEIIAGAVQRGEVHSVFSAAANLLFPPEFVLSLNAQDGPAVPNGIRLGAARGAFPFSALRPGMPVLLGAWRLYIEDLHWSVDLSSCPRWRTQLKRPRQLEPTIVGRNRERLRRMLLAPELLRVRQEEGHPLLAAMSAALNGERWLPEEPQALAELLAGRGPGLTPSGDDLLTGWLAAGWWLRGAEPAFLETCAQLVAVAGPRTHLLSRTWLSWAARGCFALPLLELLESLAEEEEERLLARAQAVLALGASSGYDLLCGLVLGLASPSLQPWPGSGVVV